MSVPVRSAASPGHSRTRSFDPRIVLGRAGQDPGHVHSRLEAGVLVEELDSGVLPCRVLDSLLAVGYPAKDGAMTL